jgi:purine nucleosidase
MKHIILDTDIGTDVDDAMALSLAALSPELDILGVTTVHADAPLRARIARKILALCGRTDIPVIPGASLPLKMPLPPNFTWMPTLRGHEGVGILSDEERTPTQDLEKTRDDAADFIIEQARQHPGCLSLVTIGALTNVGRALQKEPRLADWISDITLMGGTVDAQRFPFPPMLETNLNADPEAARLVFETDIPKTLVPMEVTTTVFLTAEHRAWLKKANHPLTTTLVRLMEEMLEGMTALSSEAGLAEDFYQGRTFMHDPLAVYSVISPHFLEIRRMNVQLEVIDQVVRTMPYEHRKPNMDVCEQVNSPAFVNFWLQRISGQTA